MKAVLGKLSKKDATLWREFTKRLLPGKTYLTWMDLGRGTGIREVEYQGEAVVVESHPLTKKAKTL